MKPTKDPKKREYVITYMVKEEDVSDLTIKGEGDYAKPVWCLGCPVTKRDEEFNMVQMLDHVVNVHKPRGDKILSGGMRQLKSHAEGMKAWYAAVAANKKKQKENA